MSKNTKASLGIDENFRDDDDEDLTKLDRGSTGDEPAKDDEADRERAKKDADDLRDENGRFKTKVKDEEGEEEEVEEEEDDKEKKPTKKTEAADEDDESEEEETEEEDKGKDKSLRFANSKLKRQRDAERDRANDLERRLAALETKEEKAKPSEAQVLTAKLEGMYEAVEEARADGDRKEAARLQREIDETNRKIATLEATSSSSVNTARNIDGAKYDAMVATLEEKYPELDPASDEFDRQLVKDFEFNIIAFERAGMRLPDALRRATLMMFREDPWERRDRKAKVEDKEPEKKVVDIKKKPDAKKAADVDKKQPPDMGGRGVTKDDAKIDFSKLTDEEFDALPESTLRKARGDAV